MRDTLFVYVTDMNSALGKIQYCEAEQRPRFQPQHPSHEESSILLAAWRRWTGIILPVKHVNWHAAVAQAARKSHILTLGKPHQPMLVSPKPGPYVIGRKRRTQLISDLW